MITYTLSSGIFVVTHLLYLLIIVIFKAYFITDTFYLDKKWQDNIFSPIKINLCYKIIFFVLRLTYGTRNHIALSDDERCLIVQCQIFICKKYISNKNVYRDIYIAQVAMFRCLQMILITKLISIWSRSHFLNLPTRVLCSGHVSSEYSHYL